MNTCMLELWTLPSKMKLCYQQLSQAHQDRCSEVLPHWEFTGDCSSEQEIQPQISFQLETFPSLFQLSPGQNSCVVHRWPPVTPLCVHCQVIKPIQPCESSHGPHPPHREDDWQRLRFWTLRAQKWADISMPTRLKCWQWEVLQETFQHGYSGCWSTTLAPEESSQMRVPVLDEPNPSPLIHGALRALRAPSSAWTQSRGAWAWPHTAWGTTGRAEHLVPVSLTSLVSSALAPAAAALCCTGRE